MPASLHFFCSNVNTDSYAAYLSFYNDGICPLRHKCDWNGETLKLLKDV